MKVSTWNKMNAAAWIMSGFLHMMIKAETMKNFTDFFVALVAGMVAVGVGIGHSYAAQATQELEEK